MINVCPYSCSFFYNKLKCRWPEQADEVWAAADKKYATFCTENRKGPVYMRYYLYPAVALYKDESDSLLRKQGTLRFKILADDQKVFAGLQGNHS